MSAEMPRSVGKNALVLSLFAVLTVGLVALTEWGTRERIQRAEQHAQLRALSEILPASRHDNDLLSQQIQLNDALLGEGSQPAWLAFQAGKPSAVILQATAPDGYSGSIRLLVGIYADGELAGVRVLNHRETPGLGDRIELAKSPWILSFNGRSLTNPVESGWAVKKDQGVFDQFAGATITPRAVVAAVHRALRYFDAHQETLFAPPAREARP